MGHRTVARPLFWMFTALVVYASLFPFDGWRFQGGNPWAFLFEPLPRYWTFFDVVSNLLGYAPLGFLLAVAAVRTGASRWGVPVACALPALLSFTLETMQVFLPARVPSNIDLALNTTGGMLGVGVAVLLARWGLLTRWTHFRTAWFADDAHGALVLLALWPLAVLYPVSVPFGLGQVWARVEVQLTEWMVDTPFAEWMLMPASQPAPLSPLAQGFCVALCLLAPCLLGFSVLRSAWRRLWFVVVCVGGGVLLAVLSSSLTHGPVHAWAWMTPSAVAGVLLAALLGLALVGAPPRWCLMLLLLSLATTLTLLNRAPQSPYLSESLVVWSQGRFIRFHGITQWLGWLWPYAVLIHAMSRAVRRGGDAIAD